MGDFGQLFNQTQRQTALIISLGFLIVLLGSLCASAQQTPSSVAIGLHKLAPGPTAELRGAVSRYNISLPIPERMNVTRARLTFAYENSTGLLKDRSRLVLEINGRPVTQTVLDPLSPQGKVTADIPVEFLETGYNQASFFAAQNYTFECSDPADPMLWTMVHLDESELYLEYELQSVPDTLAAARDFLFDPKDFGKRTVHLIIPELTEEYLKTCAIAAAGAAAHLEYRSVRFTLSTEPVPGTDNIIIGEREFIDSILQPAGADAAAGEMGIIPLPLPPQEITKEKTEIEGDQDVDEANEEKPTSDPRYGLLVISGDTPEEVRNTATAFAFLNYPLPELSWADIGTVDIPEMTEYRGKRIVRPGTEFMFEEIGFSTTSFQGLRPGGKDFNVRIPSDLMLEHNKYAVLKLHVAFGAGMRSDSVLNIFLNGEFTSAVPFNNADGGRYQGYRLEVPLYLFKTGFNTFRFEVVPTPLVTGECRMVQTENLRASIFGDSTLEFPPMRHWAEMPELSLFFEDGFPFAAVPDWRGSVVVPLEKSFAAAAAAINFTAMICQKNGIPPLETTFSFEVPKNKETNILAVGPLSAVPEELLKASPLSPEMHYRFPAGLNGKNTDLNWWDRLNKWLFPDIPDKEPAQPESVRTQIPLKTAEDTLLLTEFRSPWDSMRTVLLATAADSSQLEAGAAGMWDSYVQGLCVENMALVDFSGKDPTVAVQRAGNTYFVGNLGAFSRFYSLIENRPWIFFTGLALCILFLAWVLRKLLKRRTIEVESEP